MKTLFAAMLVAGLMLAQSVVAGEPAATSAQPAVAASQGTAAKVTPCDDKAPGAKPCPKQAATQATGSAATTTPTAK
ncbi:MAG: hypothetical protein HQL62_02365 [Magnetococcales bacterium]|nr:hypothetical protein [Magnetococcales bacterium]